MDLRDKAKKLPEVPGVYIMRDRFGNIIYVGKAKNLRNRVSQYFQSSGRHAPKIIRMIENIEVFDYIPVDTELEALLLECRLIKDLKPVYNSQMKNDRGYVYVRLTADENFPAFEIIDERDESGVCYGPYTSQKSVERALTALEDSFKLRHCRSFSARKPGCLRQQLGLCLAPCDGSTDRYEYQHRLEGALDFLKGRDLELIPCLEDKMKAAAEVLDFNKAARYRDDIRALRRMANRQQAVGFTRKNRCIAALERLDSEAVKLVILSGSRIVYKEKLDLTQLNYEYLGHLIKDLIINHIKGCGAEAFGLDKQEVDQVHIVYSYLKNKKSCSYISISMGWLKESNVGKLEQGIERLIGKML